PHAAELQVLPNPDFRHGFDPFTPEVLDPTSQYHSPHVLALAQGIREAAKLPADQPFYGLGRVTDPSAFARGDWKWYRDRAYEGHHQPVCQLWGTYSTLDNDVIEAVYAKAVEEGNKKWETGVLKISDDIYIIVSG